MPCHLLIMYIPFTCFACIIWSYYSHEYYTEIFTHMCVCVCVYCLQKPFQQNQNAKYSISLKKFSVGNKLK